MNHINWISTDAALPEKTGDYLVTTLVRSIDILQWSGYNWCKRVVYKTEKGLNCYKEEINAHLISAWAHLPEPYKGTYKGNI